MKEESEGETAGERRRVCSNSKVEPYAEKRATQSSRLSFAQGIRTLVYNQEGHAVEYGSRPRCRLTEVDEPVRAGVDRATVSRPAWHASGMEAKLPGGSGRRSRVWNPAPPHEVFHGHVASGAEGSKSTRKAAEKERRTEQSRMRNWAVSCTIRKLCRARAGVKCARSLRV